MQPRRGDLEEGGALLVGIEQQVQLDRRVVGSEGGPAVHLGGQRDHGAVQDAQDLTGLAGLRLTDPGEQQRQELFEDHGWALAVGITQGRALEPSAAEMIMPPRLGVERGFEVAQAALARKLGIDHGHKLVPAAKRLDPFVGPVMRNDRAKLAARNLLQNLLQKA